MTTAAIAASSANSPIFVINRRATVRYRVAGHTKRRAFLANSSRNVEALIMDISRGGVSLAMTPHLEPGTLLRIELENVPYVDLVATVTNASPLEGGQWRYGCEWTHGLSDTELQALRGQEDAGQKK